MSICFGDALPDSALWRDRRCSWSGLIADAPPGRPDGITVLPDRAHFQLRAPSKDHVHLRGDFNGWQIESGNLMNRSLDGNTWWLEVEGLEPGAWTRFHYLIDDTVEVADPFSPLVLDPWNDGHIPLGTSRIGRPIHRTTPLGR